MRERIRLAFLRAIDRLVSRMGHRVVRQNDITVVGFGASQLRQQVGTYGTRLSRSKSRKAVMPYIRLIEDAQARLRGGV